MVKQPAALALEIEPVTPFIGALVHGVDLADIDDATFQQIQDAFLQYQVLFFRNQHLSPPQQISLGQRFGPLARYPFIKGMQAYPEVVVVKKGAHESDNFGGLWHSDTTYLEHPPLGSILYAKKTPPVGGDTLFASMYASYEGLSHGMKALLNPLRAVSSSRILKERLPGRVIRQDESIQAAEKVFSATHPVVRTHPETGRKALFINPAHTLCFENMREEESEPLLRYLFQQASRSEYQCRFHWQVDSLAIWDNRCAWHFALNDYHGHERAMHRVTIEGDIPA